MKNLIRSIRRRFGITAPKMTVRTHVAWYWRWLGISIVGAVTLAMAAWMYDAGRRFAGFDSSELQSELARLQKEVARLETESQKLRAVTDAADARMKIEQSAQQQLTAQVKQLETENTRLKEDLALFEGFAPGERRDEPVSIQRLRVERGTMSGEYRFQVLVMQGGRRDRDFQGSLQVLVDIQQGGRNDIIPAVGDGSAEDGTRKVSFRLYRRIEGRFRVPESAKVRAVQVKLFENGVATPRATQSVKL